MYTPVNPKAEVITSASIEIYKVELFKGLKAIVKAWDSEQKLLKAWEVEVSGEEYEQWNDDSQLELLLLSKVGLTRQP